MIQVLYTSRATRPLSRAEMARLVAKASQHNRHVGITGMLIAYNGSYMQLIEGPTLSVEPLLERIRADGRHTNVVIHRHGDVAERRCPRWAMASAAVSEEEWQRALGILAVRTPVVSLDLIRSVGTAQAIIDHYAEEIFKDAVVTHGSAFGARPAS